MDENTFKIESTNFTPSVEVDYDKKHVKIIGRSVPEDAYGFYFVVTQKLKNVSDVRLIPLIYKFNMDALSAILTLICFCRGW